MVLKNIPTGCKFKIRGVAASLAGARMHGLEQTGPQDASLRPPCRDSLSAPAHNGLVLRGLAKVVFLTYRKTMP